MIPNLVRLAAPPGICLPRRSRRLHRPRDRRHFRLRHVRRLILARRGTSFARRSTSPSPGRWPSFSVGMYVASIIGGLPAAAAAAHRAFPHRGRRQAAYWSIAMSIAAIIYLAALHRHPGAAARGVAPPGRAPACCCSASALLIISHRGARAHRRLRLRAVRASSLFGARLRLRDRWSRCAGSSSPASSRCSTT